jgi:hypothetical protein
MGKRIEDKTNPFDESIEQMWIQWLFYSNSVTYSSAMTGAPDYTTLKRLVVSQNASKHERPDRTQKRRRRTE